MCAMTHVHMRGGGLHMAPIQMCVYVLEESTSIWQSQLIKWYSTPSPNFSPYIFLGLDPSPPPLVRSLDDSRRFGGRYLWETSPAKSAGIV